MTLAVLWRTSRLVQVIQDQVLYSKVLRAEWKQRETTILTHLRDIVAPQPSTCVSNPMSLHYTPSTESVLQSTPRAVCLETALSIVHNLPPSLIDHTTLSKVSMFITNSLRAPSSPFDLIRYRCHISSLTLPQMSRRWPMNYYGRLHISVQSTL